MKIKDKYRKMLGNNIRFFRKKKNLTIEDLADKGNLNSQYLGGVERGEHNISADNIFAIAKALEIEPYHFFFFPKKTIPDNLFLKLINQISGDDQELIELYYKIICEIQKSFSSQK